MYKVYILECKNKSLYTWITTDLDRRIKQHNWEIKWWAKYTAVNWPVKLVYSELANDRSVASKRECEIKKMTREKKLLLINNNL